jgi:hypothetical protein
MPVVRGLGLIVTGALAGGLAVTAYAAEAGGGRAPALAPVRFDKPVANPYFPLTPGLVTRLRGIDGGKRHEVVRVTGRTKQIQGVAATVVKDVLRRAGDGTIAEKTYDWYADDNDGNVWYLGEDTATYDRHGHVRSREGSWEAGVDGATRGTIMPAHPAVTDAYRQEYWKGHAEDQAWIVQRGRLTTVPAGTYDHVVKTLEWSRLEPGGVSVKLYAPGVGIVAEHDLSGGNETFQLTSVSPGASSP